MMTLQKAGHWKGQALGTCVSHKGRALRTCVLHKGVGAGTCVSQKGRRHGLVFLTKGGHRGLVLCRTLYDNVSPAVSEVSDKKQANRH
jgi:hypothetical protein